jgi:hypothetical protein
VAIEGSIQFATFFVSDHPSVLSAAALKSPPHPGSRRGFTWNQFEKRQLGLVLADQISIRQPSKVRHECQDVQVKLLPGLG